MATKATGFQWGGPNVIRGVSFDSPQFGGMWSGGDAAVPETQGIRARGMAFGSSPVGFQFGSTANDAFGGQWGGPVGDSVDSLIAIEGFSLVLEKSTGSERLAFSPDEPAYRSIATTKWVEEVNKMASWQATVPVDPQLYDWPFSRVVLAYDGERRFHGTLLNVERSDVTDGKLTLSGYGSLFWAGHGDITVTYADMPAHRALEDLWLRVARATDGRVRGNVTTPRPAHIDEHRIPAEGVSWSGTPASVLQEAHGYAGMAFAADLSEQATIFNSFVPGEQPREAVFQAIDGGVQPSISPEGYHNQITVVGAERAGAPGRYSWTATASQSEINRIMDGRIHGRKITDDSLDSEQACRARAETELAQDRGEYTIGGSLDVTPAVRDLVPGYTYHVDAFDAYAPAFFAPVWCTLRSITHSFGPQEATISLDFDDESGLLGHVREDLLPPLAPDSVARLDSQHENADPNYGIPREMIIPAGNGIAGKWVAGGKRGHQN